MIIPAKNATVSILTSDGSWKDISSIASVRELDPSSTYEISFGYPIEQLDNTYWRPATEEDIQRIIEYRLSNHGFEV